MVFPYINTIDRLYEENKELKRRVAELEELTQLVAVSIGIKKGLDALRRIRNEMTKEERRQKRKLRSEMRALLAMLENGQISHEEYKKKKHELELRIKEIQEQEYTKIRDIIERRKQIRDVLKELENNIIPSKLMQLGYNINVIDNESKIPEWIRKIVEEDRKLREAQKKLKR
jgi:hypothetical protein